MSALPSYAYVHAASPCGGWRVEVAGAGILCRPSGAFLVEAADALVVADLHFEKGSAYASRGQLLPPYDTRETLQRLQRELDDLRPRTVVFLGDSFHDGRAEARLAIADRERLEAIAAAHELIWVVGNHDAEGPKALPGAVVAELQLAGLDLRHEPTGGQVRGEVAGHLHPCATVFARGQASVRRRCFVTDGARMVAPAFGAYAGALSVRDPAIAGLFARRPLIGVLGADRVHAVGWNSVAPAG